MCTRRARPSHHPSSCRPLWLLLLFLEHPWGQWIQTCAPRGGSLVVPWCIAVVGRDLIYIAAAREKLGSAARERTTGPSTCITSTNRSFTWPIFHHMQYSFIIFPKKYSPLSVEGESGSGRNSRKRGWGRASVPTGCFFTNLLIYFHFGVV